MSVAAGGGESKLDKKKLMMYGIGGGIIGIYLTEILNAALNTNYFSFLAGLGVIAAIVMGSEAVRMVCGYGIGTGVPSIGLMAMGMGLIAAMFGLSIGGIAGPIIGLIVAIVFGYFVGTVANKIVKMNIPVMEETLTMLAAAGSITLMGLSIMVAGRIDYALIISSVIETGFIAAIFIAGSLAILHPFNANLGPDETQDRTLVHTITTGALAMLAAGIASIFTLGSGAGILIVIIAVVIWYWSFKWYFQLVKRDAAGVVGTGLLPKGGM